MRQRRKKFFHLANTLLLTFSLAATDLRLPESAEAASNSGPSLLSQAFRTASKGRQREAQQLADRTGDPVAEKLVDWLIFSRRDSGSTFGAIRSFLNENSDWPAQSRMALAAEKAMPDSLSDKDTISWFMKFKPRTAEGMIRFADALLRAGPRNEAAAVLNAWWPDAPLSGSEQSQILSRHGSLLTQKAHIDRFNNLMSARQHASARALAGRIGNGYPQLADARIALAERKKGAEAFVAKVPTQLQKDSGLLLERARWRRRSENRAGAIEMLRQMPQGAALYNGDDWWKERHIVARDLVDDKNFSQAYAVASAHGLSSGVGFAEGEFLSGWLALRFLHRPDDAFKHFQALYEGTATAISRARGAFWAGVAKDAAGDREAAQQWYKTAAAYQTTFYGQKAGEELSAERKPEPEIPALATADERRRFESSEMARAARLLAATGMKHEARMFLDTLAGDAQTAADFQLVADLAVDTGNRPKAVKYAKDALNKGFLITEHLYPRVPEYTSGVRENSALVNAVIRQESVFDPTAVSSAGARGLMQLMPGTAKETARRLRVAYSQQRLFESPYNVRLGATKLGQLLDYYGYDRQENKTAAKALAVAAYNAGEGNVSKWLAANGDPRRAGVDLIDWIELIPFPETRNYVQRVLEGELIYNRGPALQLASSNDSKPAARKKPKRDSM